MATITRAHLTGSTDGVPFGLAVDTGTLTVVHATNTTAGNFEEVWIWLANINTSTEIVTLAFGGTGAANKMIIQVPAESTILAVPGITFDGKSSTGVTVAGGSTTADKVNVFGHINLITA
jgi:hypothetical protein|tara:strand:- start:220 stop:579 length:360 start_codon:yes stop_codon:yes gene_type:complete